jgi:hypothetical protein
MTNAYAGIDLRAGTLANQYAEELRELLKTHTPMQLEAQNFFLNDCPRYVWPEMTAEELIAEGREAKYSQEYHTLMHRWCEVGTKRASKLLSKLTDLTEKPLVDAVAFLLTNGNRGVLTISAKIQDVIEALFGIHSASITGEPSSPGIVVTAVIKAVAEEVKSDPALTLQEMIAPMVALRRGCGPRGDRNSHRIAKRKRPGRSQCGRVPLSFSMINTK